MKIDLKRVRMRAVIAGAVLALVAGMGSTLPSAYAGGTIRPDHDKWISIGMGTRTSFNAQENEAANGSPASIPGAALCGMSLSMG